MENIKFIELVKTPFSGNDDLMFYYTILNPNFDVTMRMDESKNPMYIKRSFRNSIYQYAGLHHYVNIDFEPYLIEEKLEDEPDRRIFNMFEGFRFPYTKTDEVNPCIQPWIDHIENILCQGNKAYAKALTQWFAHIIQKPTEKSYAVIMYSGQGTGKSIIYDFFTRCIGTAYGLQVGKLDDVTMSHNTHMRGKLIINANECTNEPTKKDTNILKSIITEIELLINPKGSNQYVVPNFARLLISSNYKRCMKLDADDRRYFCLPVCNSKKNNKTYFKPLIDSLTNIETQRAFFDYLANYDLTDFKHTRPPMTVYKREMIQTGVNNLVAFMKDICENAVSGHEYRHDQDFTLTETGTMYELYNKWATLNDSKGRTSNKAGLGPELTELFELKEPTRIKGNDDKRRRYYKINRVELLPRFRQHYADDDYDYVIDE